MEENANSAHVFKVKQETLQEFHARSSLSRHTPGPPPRLHSGLCVLPWCTLSSDAMCSKHCHVTHGILHR